MNMTHDDDVMIMPGKVKENAAREHAACIPFKFHVTKKKYPEICRNTHPINDTGE
ncbi:hypothetical protein [Chitinophaga arvensicola]|uniref:hypothetical protein n=1 Tax=Chitinophaga arvensicola TaxID=29529 RepID=UPI0015A5FDC2|nr:hypothetical protein [Chitinophaga arvensicola]